MTYDEAFDFYQNAGKFRHEPTLERMKMLCRTLGDPQRSLRCVHIAGTNGKGSCAAMLEAMCRAAGMKTGLFTSPDLVDFAERVRVNGVNITRSDITRLTARIQSAAEALPPLSFFELVTALGFVYFAEQSCDIVILECGLGGRYDATNVIETPEISVIMPIGYDHTAVLGCTLAQITGEKTGIIKPRCPVVCARQEAEALTVIQKTCYELNSPLHMVDINSIIPISDSLDGQIFRYRDRTLRIPLLGAHQLENAAAAIECAQHLGLSYNAIRQGLSAVRWPCRFEWMPPFILDGAHNPHGAAALAKGLRHYFPNTRFCFIIGCMADKDANGILAELLPLAECICCVAPNSDRARSAAELAALIQGIPALPCVSAAEAIEQARKTKLPVCVCGSLYLTGEIREQVKKL